MGAPELCLSIAEGSPPVPGGEVVTTRLRVNGPAPALCDASSDPAVRQAETLLESWGMALRDLLQQWV
jgi:hypothetical protein